jgi:lactate permease
MIWQQDYDPMGNMVVSTLVACVPVFVMLGGLAIVRLKAHVSAALGLLAAFVVAVFAFGMPGQLALRAASLGALTGLLPIGWIIVNLIYLYRLTERNGSFAVLRDAIGSITEDRRLQLLLIAFAFGAFFEGAAGFGAPVAVTAAILIGLGFSPLAASGLSLLANTAPVAFGALGTPVITLAKTHGYDLASLSAMIGRQLPFFSVLVPFWLIWAFAGRRGALEIWPAILITGLSFAIVQFLVSNYMGPELVDVLAALASVGSLTLFLRIWRPRRIWRGVTVGGDAGEGADDHVVARPRPSPGAVVRASIPWIVLTVCVFVWGMSKTVLDGIYAPKIAISGLHLLIARVPPVVSTLTLEKAEFTVSLLSATGTAILVAALVGGATMGYRALDLCRLYAENLWDCRYSLATIVLMLALGTLTRYSGLDTTLGLAFASTGLLYPFFGTMMGWLGVALTGSDTASNVLFGGMQKVASAQLGLPVTLMGAANSSGGVMGKMIDAQSIVVASTATGWRNHEGDILRFVFLHSVVLASLVGVLVTLQAYVWPFSMLVVGR